MSKVGLFPRVFHDFYKPDGVDHSTYVEGPSLTRQEFAEECDINSLMARYEGHVIGGPGNMSPPVPTFVDWGHMPQTLLEYMTFMSEAEAGFMSLPAVVRKEFDNDAKMFVEFASDPENLPQMRTWGLAPPAKVPEGGPAPSPQPEPAPAPEPPKGSGAPPAQ